jgi:hypothetical protein
MGRNFHQNQERPSVRRTQDGKVTIPEDAACFSERRDAARQTSCRRRVRNVLNDLGTCAWTCNALPQRTNPAFSPPVHTVVFAFYGQAPARPHLKEHRGFPPVRLYGFRSPKLMSSFRRFREYSTFGGSFSGRVAQSFATRYPTKLRKLILASTTAKAERLLLRNTLQTVTMHMLRPIATDNL